MSTPSQRLQQLNRLLKCLLDNANLPSPMKSDYPFEIFFISPEYIEKTRSELGGLNETFKAMFGWKAAGTTGNGMIEIKESGQGIQAIVGVFQKYMAKYLGDAIIKKWLDDIIAGAEQVYHQANMEVSSVVKPNPSQRYVLRIMSICQSFQTLSKSN
jgi:hypothetical protein